MEGNELYLTVLPIIHISTGLTEQILTLHPDRNFATEFFPDEVENYANLFRSRASAYLIGGHVTRYDVAPEPLANGRVIVHVVQYVS